VTTYHLFNVKRLAYETKAPPEAFFKPVEAALRQPSAAEIEAVVRSVVKEILNLG